MKKLLSLAAVAAMVTLAACGDKGGDAPAADSPGAVTPPAADTLMPPPAPMPMDTGTMTDTASMPMDTTGGDSM